MKNFLFIVKFYLSTALIGVQVASAAAVFSDPSRSERREAPPSFLQEAVTEKLERDLTQEDIEVLRRIELGLREASAQGYRDRATVLTCGEVALNIAVSARGLLCVDGSEGKVYIGGGIGFGLVSLHGMILRIHFDDYEPAVAGLYQYLNVGGAVVGAAQIGSLSRTHRERNGITREISATVIGAGMGASPQGITGTINSLRLW